MTVRVDPERLPIWVVYDHPSDWPQFYVARLHYALPRPEPTGSVLMYRDLDPLREVLADMGCTKLDRFPEDDPAILETWIA
jgi:hypothetical protein